MSNLLPQPHPASISSALFKATPADFCVTEHLGFDLSGEGEHLCLYVEKTGANTAFIAKQLANWAGIPVRDVSFCGLKDRFAVTRQWFSLRIPKKIMPSHDFSHPEAEILKRQWHSKKLARGIHQSNHFEITLRDIIGRQDDIENQLNHIRDHGIPNYFGAQRFGRDGKNLEKITAIFSGELSKKKVKRNEYSILLSSARAYVFNQILATRVEDNTWNQAIAGDVFNLNGTGSIFTTEQLDDDIIQRISNMDIHPTAPLWGRGSLSSTGEIALLESRITDQNKLLTDGLENAGLKQERRPTRIVADNFSWEWQDNATLSLQFSLGKGCYATAILDSLVTTLASGEPSYTAKT